MNTQWQHDGHGEEPMPKVYDRFRQLAGGRRSIVDGGTGVEVQVEPGAGAYEDSFSGYWLITLWAFFGYQVLAMVVLLMHMAFNGYTYLWLPHLVGTCIIVFGTGFMAGIYRLILFPTPGYYHRAPQEYAAQPPMPHANGMYGGSGFPGPAARDGMRQPSQPDGVGVAA